MNIASPIAVRLCEGFFLWSLALISPSTEPLRVTRRTSVNRTGSL